MGKIVEGTNNADIINYPFGASYDDDTIYGYGGNDVISGSFGDDTILGGSGNDTIDGEDDNDTLKGGGGADVIDGGDGIDTASYGDSPAGVTVSLIGGMASGGDATGDELDDIENLIGSIHADTLIGDNGVNVLDGQGGNDELKGYGGGDTLWGSLGNDSLYGMEGVDTLHGQDGNDHLNGGAGSDDMFGGIGNDTYVVDNAGDDVFESVGQGNDVVRASVSWSMTAGASVETLETTNAAGTAAINFTGNANANHLIGNNGGNYLNGGGGADHMTGNGGNDIYVVDNALDWITETAGQGLDAVQTNVSWTLTPGADVETLHTTSWSSTDPLNLTGNETGNVVWGNAGNNVLNGGDGNDELIGVSGEDSFLFNTALNAATNVDVITDFDVYSDTILLDQTIFSSSLGLGNISSGELVIGAAALEANDRIIYNSATGALYYDSDGVGGTAQIQFATLSTGLALTNLDFLVVA
jgi:Ca2+-binding RTX toxin-like protein